MTMQQEQNGRKRKLRVAVAGVAALLSSGALVQSSPQETKAREKEKQVLTTQNKFYCNIKALNPAERDRGDGKRLRISVQSIECLTRGAGRLGRG